MRDVDERLVAEQKTSQKIHCRQHLEAIEISSADATTLFTKWSALALLYSFFLYVCACSTTIVKNRFQQAMIDDD
jgi:hypothetical protein